MFELQVLLFLILLYQDEKLDLNEINEMIEMIEMIEILEMV